MAGSTLKALDGVGLAGVGGKVGSGLSLFCEVANLPAGTKLQLWGVPSPFLIYLFIISESFQVGLLPHI